MKTRTLWISLIGLALLVMVAACAPPAGTQMTEAKDKPAMYSYIAVWNIPRDQWAARENQAAAARQILDRAVSDGTIVAYGFDENPLHDTFWLAMSKEGLQSVSDEFKKAGITAMPSAAGTAPSPVSILVSRYYNWHTETCKNAYVHVGIYKMRSDAPPDAVDALSRNYFAPPLEKMLADRTIFEWETDTYADPKDAPGTFLIAYLSETEEGLNKANDAVQKTLKSRPLKGPAFDALVDVGASRDVVVRSYAAYK
jgi:hypothetical protein